MLPLLGYASLAAVAPDPLAAGLMRALLLVLLPSCVQLETCLHAAAHGLHRGGITAQQ